MLNTLRFIISHPLNRQHKIAALFRYLKWQIFSRLVKGPVKVRFVNDAVLLVKHGMTGATGNIYCGLHEFEEMAFLLHYLRRDDLFFDIGANVGSYTVLASAVIGAKTQAFEPVPETYSALSDNIRVNNIENLVEARLVAIGDTDGDIQMTNNLDTTNHIISSLDPCAGKMITVPEKKISNYIGNKIPDLIKIDVEGYETKVINGAEELFAGDRPGAVIMELNGSGKRYGFDENKLHQKMMKFGYRTYIYDPFKRELEKIDTRNTKSGNALYLKDPVSARERLSTATAFHVLEAEI